LSETREKVKLKDKISMWDKQMMYMEQGADRKKMIVEELDEKVKSQGLGGVGEDSMDTEINDRVDTKLARELEVKTAIEQTLTANQASKEDILSTIGEGIGADVLRQEMQLDRRHEKLKSVNKARHTVSKEKHATQKKLAALASQDPDDTGAYDVMSDTDEEEAVIQESYLPEGWTTARYVLKQMVKHDAKIQAQLRETRDWWGDRVRSWQEVEAHIVEKWEWDESQLYFLDELVEATGKRQDIGKLKATIDDSVFFEIFFTAVVEGGRDPFKFAAFKGYTFLNPEMEEGAGNIIKR